MLAKFGIQPMEIGLNIVAVYQNGDVFDSEVLSIDEAEYLNRIQTAAGEALNLAVYIAYPTEDTIKILLQKAEREKLALESKVPIVIQQESKEELTEVTPIEETPAEEPVQEERTQNSNENTKNTMSNLSGYSEEAVKEAEKLINQIKDNS